MPRKLYTPEQRKEKQRERARNYQKKRTLQNRIIRYSCFLINNDYTILRNEDFDKLQKNSKKRFKSRLIAEIAWVILFIAFIIK